MPPNSELFRRVKLFTDVENVTLTLWLDLDQTGHDSEAIMVLNAGLSVEHMIAEMPLTAGLRDSQDLRILIDEAFGIFGLIVDFDRNQALIDETTSQFQRLEGLIKG